MNIREFTKPVTAASLNESLAKRFGTKVNVESFTLEQLQDARNKLRTKLSQVETLESYDAVHKSEGYQKSKLFLDVLNAAIQERAEISEGKKKKGSKPDYLDFDKDGDKKEPMKKAIKDKKKKGPVKEAAGQATCGCDSSCKHCGGKHSMNEVGKDCSCCGKKIKEGKMKESKEFIREGKEDEAELVMAAKDMVDRVTGWMEDTAEMQTESMLELADAIRDELGQEQSDQFVAAVKPALEALYTTMETTRGSLTDGVAMLTGEGAPVDMMGADEGGEELPDMGEPGEEADMEPTVDQDEFGAAEPAAGGEEEAGRAKRESVERTRRIATILSSKKK